MGMTETRSIIQRCEQIFREDWKYKRTDWQKSLGKLITFARYRTGLKQYQVATIMGMNRSNMSAIERGRRSISPQLADEILELLQRIENSQKEIEND